MGLTFQQPSRNNRQPCLHPCCVCFTSFGFSCVAMKRSSSRISLSLVRKINQNLSSDKHLRVLAGDPPVDWSKVKEQKDVMLDRDANIAAVMEKDVLSKHRKALMLFGTFHLFHKNKIAPKGLESAVRRYETDYPGVTMVIGTAMIFDLSTAPPAEGELEARMAPWPVPSLIRQIKGTWLMDINKYFFSEMVD